MFNALFRLLFFCMVYFFYRERNIVLYIGYNNGKREEDSKYQ